MNSPQVEFNSRLTADDLAVIFHKYNLKAHQGSMEFNGLHACGLAAFCVDSMSSSQLNTPGNDHLWNYLYDVFGRDYVNGYWRGFDEVFKNDKRLPESLTDNERSFLGYQDGLAGIARLKALEAEQRALEQLSA